MKSLYLTDVLQGFYKAVYIDEHKTECHFKNVLGKVHIKVLPITIEQINNFSYGEAAQIAFPNLSPEDRELFITGLDKEEWDSMFNTFEDEYEYEI